MVKNSWAPRTEANKVECSMCKNEGSCKSFCYGEKFVQSASKTVKKGVLTRIISWLTERDESREQNRDDY